MYTPYDWQEAVGNRAQYVESRLAGGAPVIGVSLGEGVLLFSVRRQARKIYEVYDCLAFSAIGQQSDIESLRVAAVEFAHQEGYQRSEEDVTIQRVVSALSQPLKRAFGDFNTSPFMVRSLFAEVCESREEDKFYILDYDGDYSVRARWAIITGTGEIPDEVRTSLNKLAVSASNADKALPVLEQAWATLMTQDDPKDFASLIADLTPEAVLLERSNHRHSRFTMVRGA